MPTLTITVDSRMLALGASAIAAAALVLSARMKRGGSTTIWWIKPHKRYVLASMKPSDLIVITDFDATLTAGDAEQCHDVMGNSKLLVSEFRNEFAPLLDCAHLPTGHSNPAGRSHAAPGCTDAVAEAYIRALIFFPCFLLSQGRPIRPSTASSGGTSRTV